MVTEREARQRLAINRMCVRKIDGEYRVNFIECDREATAYYTDCREDAMLTGAAMRRRMQDQISRAFVAGRTAA